VKARGVEALVQITRRDCGKLAGVNDRIGHIEALHLDHAACGIPNRGYTLLFAGRLPCAPRARHRAERRLGPGCPYDRQGGRAGQTGGGDDLRRQHRPGRLLPDHQPARPLMGRRCSRYVFALSPWRFPGLALEFPLRGGSLPSSLTGSPSIRHPTCRSCRWVVVLVSAMLTSAHCARCVSSLRAWSHRRPSAALHGRGGSWR
jgi:hypothetical protein